MNPFLAVLGIMVVCVVGLGSLVVPSWSFLAFGGRYPEEPNNRFTKFCARRKYWLILLPFLVIPALAAIVVAATPPSTNANYCHEGTVYQEYVVGSGKSRHTEWGCFAR